MVTLELTLYTSSVWGQQRMVVDPTGSLASARSGLPAILCSRALRWSGARFTNTRAGNQLRHGYV